MLKKISKKTDKVLEKMEKAGGWRKTLANIIYWSIFAIALVMPVLITFALAIIPFLLKDTIWAFPSIGLPGMSLAGMVIFYHECITEDIL